MIWQSIDFWEMAIYSSLQEEANSEFFNYEFDVNPNATKKELIYVKLAYLITDMLSLRMEKSEVKKLVVKYVHRFELLPEHQINLIEKVANYGMYSLYEDGEK